MNDSDKSNILKTVIYIDYKLQVQKAMKILMSLKC